MRRAAGAVGPGTGRCLPLLLGAAVLATASPPTILPTPLGIGAVGTALAETHGRPSHRHHRRVARKHAPAPATADPAAAQAALQQAEQDRAARLAAQQKAEAGEQAARAEADRLAQQRTSAAARLRAAETATEDAAVRMDALAQREAAAQRRLRQRAAEFAPLLPLLERLSLYPAETLLAVPLPPEQALRGALVLKGISRELERQAQALRAEEVEVATLQAAIRQEAPALARARAEQAAQEAALDRQIAAARQAEQAAEDAAAAAERAAAVDAARASNLRDALAKLEADRRAAEAKARAEEAAAERHRQDAAAAAARDQAVALAAPDGPGLPGPGSSDTGAGLAVAGPVVGKVIRAWGDPTEIGPAEGISYRAAPDARVVAPCRGKVVFAAPFRSYGLLLILDCGGGYHFVLAGLERFDVEVGDAVQVGEPVGVMPGWDPRTSGKRPALYVELRHDGRPVDPAPWLKTRSPQAQGPRVGG
ncbi:MAG TPA: peptidoglycan DD-metalloendopeptidase family protein [Acetobacteraceae bacterium]|nr:peptidoglycan DD-metalloendopeptidase family protein [Acetobacteraceae bacterium]